MIKLERRPRVGLVCAILGWLLISAPALNPGPAVAADQVIIATPADARWTPCDAKVPEGCQFVVVQGDVPKGPAVRLMKAPAGHVFVPHRHPSTPEHITMISGNMLLGYEGGTDQYVGRDAYVFIAANLVHWARCLEPCVFSLVTTGPFDFIPADKK
jgi:quercetin dioxygenase-like cupin family protein